MLNHHSAKQGNYVFWIALWSLLLFSWAPTGVAAPDSQGGQTIQLFNGRNLDGWYTYTVQTKYRNPGIFTVVNGILRISGGSGTNGYFGGVVTKKAYSNYKLSFEYKWGGPTYGSRHNRARDSGVMLHCVGPNGPGPWMTSYEFQVIEGGTGDLLVVNATKQDDAGQPIDLRMTSEGFRDGNQRYYQKGGEKLHFLNSGRLNWWGRDPHWKDQAGYRGRQDVQSPFGQWTQCEAIVQGDEITCYVNGRLVNHAWGLNITKGKILFQTEGAEVWYRNIKLTLLPGGGKSGPAK